MAYFSSIRTIFWHDAQILDENRASWLEADPVAEVREDRQEGYHLPSFCGWVEVEHERVEVVRSVAKADVHVMLHLSGLE